MTFPVVMYRCGSWTIKKVECWRIDAFKLWCWRRLLRVPWTASRSNQSILKEINPGYSLEGLMLKLQYFGQDEKSWLIWKDPDAGKDWRQEEKGETEDEMVGWCHWLHGYKFERGLGDSEGREAWRAAVHGVTKSWTQPNDWTTKVTQIADGDLCLYLSPSEWHATRREAKKWRTLTAIGIIICP